MEAFILQLGHPKISSDKLSQFDCLKEIFRHLFRTEEESIYLFWHDIPLRLRYREDLFRNFDAILAMTRLIQRDVQGAATVDLTTQLLSIHWELRWQEDRLTISSSFIALDDVYSPYSQTLNEKPELEISKQDFLGEWKPLLHQIIVSFRAGNVAVADGTERRKWEMLQRVEQQIPNYGRLYTRPQ